MKSDSQRQHRATVRRAAVCMALAFLAFAPPAPCVPDQESEARALPEKGPPVGDRMVTVYVNQLDGPPSGRTVQLPRSVLEEIESQFPDQRARWDIWDITHLFSWVRHGRMLTFLESHTYAYLDASGNAVFLNKQSNDGELRKILEAEFPDPLHDRTKFQEMFDALQFLTVPGGMLGTEEYFSWIQRDDEKMGTLRAMLSGKVKDVAIFRKYCRGPIYAYDKRNGNWSLSFYAFNWAGGVSLVKAHGSDKPFRVEEITVEEVMEPGSFNYPQIV